MVQLGKCSTDSLIVAEAYPETYFYDNGRKKRASAFVVERQSRIVGGAKTNILDTPWQVSLHADGVHTCGASILNSEWIISAAHCTNTYDSGRNTEIWTAHAQLNTTNNLGKGQSRNIVKIVQHIDFDDVTYENDVVILKLDKKLEYNDFVQPICLPSRERNCESFF